MPRNDNSKNSDDKLDPLPVDGAERSKKTEDVGGGSIEIKLNRVAKVNGKDQTRGFKLGTVTLEKGVTLNYLTDAIRGGTAGVVEDDD